MHGDVVVVAGSSSTYSDDYDVLHLSLKQIRMIVIAKKLVACCCSSITPYLANLLGTGSGMVSFKKVFFQYSHYNCRLLFIMPFIDATRPAYCSLPSPFPNTKCQLPNILLCNISPCRRLFCYSYSSIGRTFLE